MRCTDASHPRNGANASVRGIRSQSYEKLILRSGKVSMLKSYHPGFAAFPVYQGIPLTGGERLIAITG